MACILLAVLLAFGEHAVSASRILSVWAGSVGTTGVCWYIRTWAPTSDKCAGAYFVTWLVYMITRQILFVPSGRWPSVCIYFSMSAHVDELHLIRRNRRHKTSTRRTSTMPQKVASKCIQWIFFLSVTPRISMHFPNRRIPVGGCTLKVICVMEFCHWSEVCGGTRYLGICWLITTESVGLD